MSAEYYIYQGRRIPASHLTESLAMEIMAANYPKLSAIPQRESVRPVSDNFATTARRTPHKETLKRAREQGLIDENGELLSSLFCMFPACLSILPWQCMHMKCL